MFFLLYFTRLKAATGTLYINRFTQNYQSAIVFEMKGYILIHNLMVACEGRLVILVLIVM
jgi:hypothetical protein